MIRLWLGCEEAVTGLRLSLRRESCYWAGTELHLGYDLAELRCACCDWVMTKLRWAVHAVTGLWLGCACCDWVMTKLRWVVHAVTGLWLGCAAVLRTPKPVEKSYLTENSTQMTCFVSSKKCDIITFGLEIQTKFSKTIKCDWSLQLLCKLIIGAHSCCANWCLDRPLRAGDKNSGDWAQVQHLSTNIMLQ